MDEFEWTTTNESKLLEAMVGYKPIGINKSFQMACIWEKLQELEVDISSKIIWDHLKTMYNLEALNDLESLPFPNDEREFFLPDSEFSAMKVKKEEKPEPTSKQPPVKRAESKEPTKVVAKDAKKEEKTTGKKETLRRDSKDGKDTKPVAVKKEVKKEPADKGKPVKRNVSKEEDKAKATPNRTEDPKRQKRPLRGSSKPEDLNTPSNKGQSPVTVTPTPPVKRRRI